MKNYEDRVKALEESIPRHVISKRRAYGNVELDYLEGWYVQDRLNQIFGNTNWSYSIKMIQKVGEFTTVNNYKKEVFNVSAVAEVVLLVPNAQGQLISYSDIGYGSGSDKVHYGPAHELAFKEAVTDALKRAAKALGKSTGLALYDRTGEFIDEDNKSKPSAKSADTKTSEKAEPKAKKATGAKAPEDRNKLNTAINAASVTIITQKKMTKEEILAKMKKDFKTAKKEDLSLPQAKKFFKYLDNVAQGEANV